MVGPPTGPLRRATRRRRFGRGSWRSTRSSGAPRRVKPMPRIQKIFATSSTPFWLASGTERADYTCVTRPSSGRLMRSSPGILAILILAMTAPASPKLWGFGQSEGGRPPRTAWGDPDLQGIWNYATMTPLERSRDLGQKAVFTAEEAAAFDREGLDPPAFTNNTPPPPNAERHCG